MLVYRDIKALTNSRNTHITGGTLILSVETLEKLRIEAKSENGRKRISAGLGNSVVVLAEYANRFLVAPATDPKIGSRFVRNVMKDSDPNFKWEKVN